MKDSKLVAAGKVNQVASGLHLQIPGSNEVLALVADSTSAPAPNPSATKTSVVEGTIPESGKGKTPDLIRYRSITTEK